MFGNDSLPSRIYSYGAKVPVENLERVNDQMYGAHKYRNALVEVERKRRDQVEALLVRLSPELAETETKIAAELKALEAVRTRIDQASASARKKVYPEGAKEEAKISREKVKGLRVTRKELRTALFASESWKKESESIELEAKASNKKLRSECGLYWGTYLHIEGTMGNARSGAPPRFHRWDWDGNLGVQLQGGLSVKDALGGSDMRIRIDRVPDEAYLPGGRKLRKTKVHFRVGSDEKGCPIFAVVPIVLHRPLPHDADIKWAHLIRRRIGTHSEWRMQFVLSRAAGWVKTDLATDGAAGIDVGWRMLPDRSMRVARWTGSDGEDGELTLPADWLSEMRKTEDIQSIRDGLFNEAKAALVERLAAVTIHQGLREDAQTIVHWKSAARLAYLAIRWRTERFPGDEEALAALEAWRKRDKHLLEYGANLRDQLQRRREDIYRNFAAQMRRKYKTAFVEKLDLRDFHVLPKSEEKQADGAVREHTRDACLSFLFQCLKESMSEIVFKDPKNTTKLHFDCGNLEEFDRKELFHTCSHCGVLSDQDLNAAKNLLSGRMDPVPVS